MRTVLIGFYGMTLDFAGAGPARWKKWRPTLSLFQQEDLLIDRLELLRPTSAQPLVLTDDIRRASPDTRIAEHDFDVDDPWDFESVYAALFDFARAYEFKADTRYLVHLTTGTHVAQICLFLLTEARFIPAELVQSSPKAPGVSVVNLDLSQYDAITQRFDAERAARQQQLSLGIETKSPLWAQLIRQVEEVAHRSRAPILLDGATGVGKTHLARRIHALKARAGQVSGELVEVNCATLRGDQAMSTLFGHRRGAFTGAERDRTGLLERANGSVLFLDEIGELGLDEQAMLLTAVEDKRFLRLGDDEPRHSDFQLIAGTNRDLRRAVATGSFRDDLLARIDLWHFHLPSLAERRQDIGPNLDFELARFAETSGRRVRFRPDARSTLMAFAESERAAWLNNFRDLSACATRLATLAKGGFIETGHVDAEILRLEDRWAAQRGSEADGHPSSDSTLVAAGVAVDELDEFDRVQLAHVIQVCRQSPSIAAAGRRLFAVSRTKKSRANDADRLRKYLARFGVDAAALVGIR